MTISKDKTMTIEIPGVKIEVVPSCPICDSPVKRADLKAFETERLGEKCYVPMACCSLNDCDHANEIDEHDFNHYWKMWYIKHGEKLAHQRMESHIANIKYIFRERMLDAEDLPLTEGGSDGQISIDELS